MEVLSEVLLALYLVEKAWKAALIIIGREDGTSEDSIGSIVDMIAHSRRQEPIIDRVTKTALEAYANGASILGAVTYAFPDMRDGGWEFYTGPFMQ